MSKKDLNSIQIQALDTLASALFGYPVPAIDNIEGVYNLLQVHAVDTLAGDILRDIPSLTPELRRKWTASILTRINLNERNLQAQKELLDLLSQNGYRTLIIKGMAASQYYPQPLLRVLGDVDFLINPEEEAEITDLLIKNGYHHNEERQNKHHLSFSKQGQEFELHRKLGFPAFDNSIEEYDAEMSLKNTDTLTCSFDGYSSVVYPDCKNGLVFLSHFAQHLLIDNDVGLRQLMDWAVFANKVLDDEFWYNELLPIVKKFGLEELAVALTRICLLYFHFDEEKYSFALKADKEICEKLMINVFENGNFAHGIEKDSRATVSIITENKSVSDWFKMLQKRGLRKWKAAQRYPVLKPFAWIYQIYDYLRKTVSRKNAGIAFAKDYKSARDHQEIIDALKLS